jgi:hypothetical protein
MHSINFSNEEESIRVALLVDPLVLPELPFSFDTGSSFCRLNILCSKEISSSICMFKNMQHVAFILK